MKTNQFDELLQQAVLALQARGCADGNFDMQQIDSLLHELRVHQTELEMQNEELRRIQQELESSREKYSGLYDFAPVAYFILSSSGQILEANLTGAGLLGEPRSRILESCLPKYLAPESKPVLHQHLSLAFTSRTAQSCEVMLRRQDDQRIWVRIDSIVSEAAGQAGLQCRSVASDVTKWMLTQESPRQGEERLRHLGDNIPAGAIYQHVRRPDGSIYYAYMSAGIEKIVGMKAEAVMADSAPFLELIAQEDLPQWSAAAAQSAHELAPFDCEFRQRTVTGQVRWVHCRSTPRRLDDGAIVWDGVVTDITERKRAEETLHESEERFRTAFEKGAIAMALTAMDNSFLQVNPALCQMLGFSEAELVGHPFTEFTHPDDVAANLAGSQRMICGETAFFRLEKRYIRKDGKIVWGDMCTATVRDAQGTPLYFVTHIQDITERKQAAEALRAANSALAEADRRKDEFLAMLAHELRNPLAPIRNAVQVMRIVGAQEPALQRQRDIVDRQVTHLARLLGDLLDVSRITRGKIELKCQPLHLTDVLAHAVETATPLIESRRHTLNLTLPPDDLRVDGDLDRLAQAVGNLLANAAKYTPEDGQLWLEATCEDGQAAIRVRDNGVGIAGDMLPHVFELFAQADHSLARTQGGLGIGLTMVRNLIQMHGGTVDAYSAGLGQGSEFIIRLPAITDESRESAPPQSPEGQKKECSTRRILVVDDVADTTVSLAELLGLWGHEVRMAFDGAAALELARGFHPDVVLLDIGLPGMDGFEVARRLRQNYASGKALLVALTGYAQDSDRQAACDAGFDVHMSKPVDLPALRELLARS